MSQSVALTQSPSSTNDIGFISDFASITSLMDWLMGVFDAGTDWGELSYWLLVQQKEVLEVLLKNQQAILDYLNNLQEQGEITQEKLDELSDSINDQLEDIQTQLDGISSQIRQFERDLFGYLVPRMEQLLAENQKILNKLALIQDALLVILEELDLIELQIEWNNITTQLANHLQKIEYLHLRMSQLNLLNPENTDGSAQAASTTADLAQVFSSEIVAWAKAVLDPGAGVTFGLQAMNSIILKKTAFSRSILEVFVDLMQQGAVSSNQPAVTLQQYALNLAMAQGKGFMCVAQACEYLVGWALPTFPTFPTPVSK